MDTCSSANENNHALAAVPAPPCSNLHPLHILESYLESLETATDTNDDVGVNNSGSIPHAQSATAHQDEILRVVDFLFESILEGSLAILNSSETLISKVVSAPSHRFFYLVQTSSSSSSTRRVGGGQGSTRTSSGPSDYLCLLPAHKSSSSYSPSPIYYCSCRSFYEKSRATWSGRHSIHQNSGIAATGRSSPSLCKHLLALKLMPLLRVQCSMTELNSDDEFCRVILSRTGVDY